MVKSNPVTRKYSYSDVVMLTTIDTLVELALKNETLLAAQRPGWAPPFFTNFQNQLNQTVHTHLGIDSAKNLRKASAVFTGLQGAALKKLGDMKEEIKQNFKDDPITQNELLTTLGFKEHFTEANSNKSQDALIDLLFTFSQNATAEDLALLTAKGVDPALATTIIGYAQTLKDANVQQETLKTTRKGITAETINAFNALYDEGVRIASLAARYTRDDKPLSQSFSFAKLAQAQKAALKAKKQSPPDKPDDKA
jgi:hypothetical protein